MSFIMDKTKLLQKLVYDIYTHQLHVYGDLGDSQHNVLTVILY